MEGGRRARPQHSRHQQQLPPVHRQQPLPDTATTAAATAAAAAAAAVVVVAAAAAALVVEGSRVVECLCGEVRQVVRLWSDRPMIGTSGVEGTLVSKKCKSLIQFIDSLIAFIDCIH